MRLRCGMFAFAVAALLSTPVARAQPAPTPGPPTVTWLKLRPPGDATGLGGPGDRADELALEPLRLGLTGDVFPRGLWEPNCGDRGGIAPFASAQATAIRLVPHLTLFGFSRGGCAIDGLVGGGIAYVKPVSPGVHFALSAGALLVPHGTLGDKPVSRTQARANLIFNRPGGRSWSVGIATGTGGPRLSVGGVF